MSIYSVCADFLLMGYFQRGFIFSICWTYTVYGQLVHLEHWPVATHRSLNIHYLVHTFLTSPFVFYFITDE